MLNDFSLKREFIAVKNLSKNKNMVIKKSDKGKSVVTVSKAYYSDKIKNLPNDTQNDTLNFAVNQKNISNMLIIVYLHLIVYLKKQRDLLNQLG